MDRRSFLKFIPAVAIAPAIITKSKSLDEMIEEIFDHGTKFPAGTIFNGEYICDGHNWHPLIRVKKLHWEQDYKELPEGEYVVQITHVNVDKHNECKVHMAVVDGRE